MKILDVIVAILLVIGGLNWGLIAVADMDIVAMIFGAGTHMARLIYGLVGLSAVYQIFQWKAIQTRWGCRS